MTHHSFVQHSVPSCLHALARKDLLLRSTACHIVPWHCSPCHSHVSLCHSKKWHVMVLHSILHWCSSFCSKKQCAAFCSIVHCAMAWCIMPWHCLLCCSHGVLLCYHEDGGKQSACAALAAMAALWQSFWPWWLFFAEAVALLSFEGGKQSTCSALVALAVWQALWLVASWVFALFCCGITHSSAVFWGTILCCSTVLCAMVLCFVLYCCAL